MVATLAASAVLAAPAQAQVTVRVGAPLPGVAPIAPGYVGLALEYQSAARYAGGSAATPNRVFEQLVRNLAPGQSPVIRIGGDSTDHTWWPAPGLVARPGLTYALTPGWIGTIATLARDLDARLTLGINLEANSPAVARAEANALLAGIGEPYVDSLQIGNEPSLYGSFSWYTSNGHRVPGRRRGWSVRRYLKQYAAIRRVLPALPLAGPDLGDVAWMGQLATILSAEPRIDEVTYHRYAGNRCFGRRGTPSYPSVANLLSAADSRGLADTITRYAALARRRHDTFRVDELNTEACGGKSGVSDTFASALWALDTLFAMAADGATGVNIQTFPSARYRLFTFAQAAGQWSATIAPEYYGLLLFAQAAPAGARLLATSGGMPPAVRVWATQAVDGSTRILLIDDSTTSPVTVRILVPGATATGGLVTLDAPSAYAKSGVMLGGQSFATPTTTGTLAGQPAAEPVPAGDQGYTVTVHAASAALLTVPGR